MFLTMNVDVRSALTRMELFIMSPELLRDALAYELYGSTEDEIRIVEGTASHPIRRHA
jgi:hypothetical protein